jgi:myo-inositol-1(or 4)-monophosphatase
MKDLDLPSLLLVAREAAEEAGALVMKGFRSRPHVDHKGRIDLVTEFDRASEELLKKRLTSRTPFGFVGEEGGGDRKDLTWYVDPIDGTSNFVHGHPFWNVSIGLVEHAQPILGVVVAPALDLRWTGGRGIPAERNGVPCRVSGVALLNDALLATGFPYDFATGEPDNVAEFVAMKRHCLDVRRCGAAAIDLGFVADGTYEGYWERKLQPWDFAGGGAIVLAAGGKISAFDGGTPDLTSGAMLSSNGLVHDAMVTVLTSV